MNDESIKQLVQKIKQQAHVAHTFGSEHTTKILQHALRQLTAVIEHRFEDPHPTAPVDAKAVYTAAFRAVLTEFHGLSEGSADMSSALEPWLRRIHEESPEEYVGVFREFLTAHPPPVCSSTEHQALLANYDALILCCATSHRTLEQQTAKIQEISAAGARDTVALAEPLTNWSSGRAKEGYRQSQGMVMPAAMSGRPRPSTSRR